MKRLFHLGLLGLGLLAVFGYGFAVARWEVFPYGMLQRAAHPLGGSAGGEDSGGERPTKDWKGWFERARQPTAGEVEEGMDDLAALGYASTYEHATGRASGVVVHDRAAASPGYNFVVSAHAPGAQLLDMDGEQLHEWSFPYEQLPPPTDYTPKGSFGMEYWRRALLLPGGSVLAVFDRTALIKVDRHSRLLWHLHGDYHHDVDVTADGTIWALRREDVLRPRFSEEKPTVEDFITRISPDGRVLSEVSLLKALERSEYEPLLMKAAAGGDIFHTNSLDVFDGAQAQLGSRYRAGNAMVSLWGLDAIAIVNLKEERVVWATTGKWHRQHEPVLLSDGHLLLFDNMGVRLPGPEGEAPRRMSKVLEFEPDSLRTVWSYVGTPENDFYSALCGSVQRLPNGNTLVTESLSGRAFEVDRAGEVVWRWDSPHRVGPNEEGVAVLMDVVRLPASFSVEALR